MFNFNFTQVENDRAAEIVLHRSPWRHGLVHRLGRLIRISKLVTVLGSSKILISKLIRSDSSIAVYTASGSQRANFFLFGGFQWILRLKSVSKRISSGKTSFFSYPVGFRDNFCRNFADFQCFQAFFRDFRSEKVNFKGVFLYFV